LVSKKVSPAQYVDIVKRAEELRQNGGIVSVLPMARNLGRQIELLEQNGFTEFEKIYGD
jgi:histidyl-tRNA synthetase